MRYLAQFRKTGAAVYVSHLDLMRTMQRAFLRAGFPLAYSEGFNPHAILSMALPLSVGMESVCELMDFRLRDPADPAVLPERLTAAMPEAARTAAVASIPAGRMGDARDVARAVAFLASDEAGYITGQVLAVDGGMSM